MFNYLRKIFQKTRCLASLFFKHDYLPQSFVLKAVPHNIKILARLKKGDRLTSSLEGFLSLRQVDWVGKVLNFLSLNAIGILASQAAFYTFALLTQEIQNPITSKALKRFYIRKIRLLSRLRKKLQQVPIPKVLFEETANLMNLYERLSLLQIRLLKKIEKAKLAQSPLYREAKEGISKGYHPILVIQGSSGTYWMRSCEREVVGIFKPFDEEPFAPNNPSGAIFAGPIGRNGMRKGIYSGEMAHREVAAFLVDAFFGFGMVPYTQYALFSEKVFYDAREGLTHNPKMKTKKGSLQTFIPGLVSIDHLGKETTKSLEDEEVHLLFCLDVILGNTDRHLYNILFAEDGLVAIDHGLTFSNLHEKLRLDYIQYFPQGRKPFLKSIEQMLLEFPFEQLSTQLAKKTFISLKALDRLYERIALVQACILKQKTLQEIAEIMTSENLSKLYGLKSTALATAKSIVT